MTLNFNNFKKVAAVAIFIATAVSLFPESAQAGLAKGDGKSGNSGSFNFDLNTSVINQASIQEKDKKGFFPGAIQNFNSIPVSGTTFNNKNICGNPLCPPGHLTITKLTTSNGKADGNVLTTYPNGNVFELKLGLGNNNKQPISLKKLQKLLDKQNRILENESDKINLVKNDGIINDVLMYNITFSDTSPEPDFIWFIESSDFNLINDLSGLTRFNQIIGTFAVDVDLEDINSSGGQFTMTLQEVPEPTATVGLLGIGVLSAVSLLKRNKCINKSV